MDEVEQMLADGPCGSIVTMILQREGCGAIVASMVRRQAPADDSMQDDNTRVDDIISMDSLADFRARVEFWYGILPTLPA